MSTINKTFRLDDTLTDMTTVKLSDSTGTYGVKRNDTDAVVVADGTAMTKSSTGVYTYTFTDPADDLTYTYVLEVVYGGETYHISDTFTGPSALDTYALTTLAKVKTYLGIANTDSNTILTRIINSVTAGIENYCGRKFKARAYTMERQDGGGSNFLYVNNYPIISVERVATTTTGALQIKCTDTGAYSATASITRSSGSLPANTHLKLSILGGSNAGDNSLALATYTTLTTLAAAGTALTGWDVSVVGDYGAWASTELIIIGSSECKGTTLTMEVPYERLSNYLIDQEEGSIFYGIGFSEAYKNVYLDYNGGYATIPADLEQTAIEIISDVFESRGINANLKSEKIGDYSYTLGDIQTAVASKADQLAIWKRYGYR